MILLVVQFYDVLLKILVVCVEVLMELNHELLLFSDINTENITTRHVEYYFDIEIDREIDLELLSNKRIGNVSDLEGFGRDDSKIIVKSEVCGCLMGL